MGESLELAWIQERVRSNLYVFTFRADEERRDEGVSIVDVEQAILGGRLLEDYPNDRPGPVVPGSAEPPRTGTCTSSADGTRQDGSS